MGQVDKSAFDIKLARGVLREVTLEEVLRVRGGHDIELKSDEMCATTGNVFVEFRQHGRPSGIHPDSTHAEWWTVEVLPDVFLTQRTTRMRALARAAYAEPKQRRLNVGDNQNDGVLVPVQWLLQPWQEAA